MDATDKMAERLLEWLRNHAPDDGARVYDDNDGVSIGIDGHINICKLVSFLLHGNVTHTLGPPPELARAGAREQELVQAALQNLPGSLVSGKTAEEIVRR